jgi:hypothetical protein
MMNASSILILRTFLIGLIKTKAFKAVGYRRNRPSARFTRGFRSLLSLSHLSSGVNSF